MSILCHSDSGGSRSGKVRGLGDEMKRDWRLAEEKRGPCRMCEAWPVDLANTMGKAWQDVEQEDGSMLVVPDSVIPLCASHHRLYDSYR